MPIFKTSAAAQTLFTTVNEKKEIILTSGTYIIGRLDRIPKEQSDAQLVARGNYTEVFKSTYSEGTAPSNNIFKPDTDVVFIYPNGYYGTTGTGDVLLEPNLESVSKNNVIKINYIKSKIEPETV